MLQNTPSCTIDKKSGEYAPIPLNIVCVVIHYLIFFYKNKYFYNFFYKILVKYSPKRTKLHHFFKFSRGSMSPNPLANAVGVEIFLGGSEIFGGGVQKFTGVGLRNFRGVENFLVDGVVEKFQGGLRFFREGLRFFREMVKFFREGLRFFREGLRFFWEGLRFFFERGGRHFLQVG